MIDKTYYKYLYPRYHTKNLKFNQHVFVE